MEELVVEDAGKHTRDFVIVRPTLLTDGAPLGVGAVKVGWEWGNRTSVGKKNTEGEGPMLGYTIARKDVGEWVFEKVLREGGWEGKAVSLTY